ncbi:tetratricopeptide repeat protein [Helicobacter cetorum]|uniref:beta-lactamase n=1 Tax=Helicobacter cetorum (strain ATCC BAA-540 / CCUG 52418 / MIT 99-5656) TaxID=1163745 RepID=I0EQD4_HELCM|nr:SEL1-like repeat protein [Helicobacter cetorum]AFI05153.1 hypothetical protein HCD_00605 [Helicobacter cetorum MIT 99-5656]
MGNAISHHSLGNMYIRGQYVEKDLKKAFVYYEKSADLGNAIAHYDVGCAYFKGIGIKQNFKKTFELSLLS